MTQASPVCVAFVVDKPFCLLRETYGEMLLEIEILSTKKKKKELGVQ